MCVFCKIIAKEIPAYMIYEDDFVVAFLDISPCTIGHTLVVPKVHIENILGLDSDISNHIFSATTKITKALSKHLSVSDFNIISNNGSLAGQTIDHFHLHIIPRYKDDNMKIQFSSNKLSNEQFTQLAQSIEYELQRT